MINISNNTYIKDVKYTKEFQETIWNTYSQRSLLTIINYVFSASMYKYQRKTPC